jgi:phosphohistidine phosphatase SixA
MDHTITPLERAFRLAKSGSYASVADIKRRLTAEGYAVTHVTGRTLSTQLLALIQAARARSDA